MKTLKIKKDTIKGLADISEDDSLYYFIISPSTFNYSISFSEKFCGNDRLSLGCLGELIESRSNYCKGKKETKKLKEEWAEQLIKTKLEEGGDIYFKKIVLQMLKPAKNLSGYELRLLADQLEYIVEDFLPQVEEEDFETDSNEVEEEPEPSLDEIIKEQGNTLVNWLLNKGE